MCVRKNLVYTKCHHSRVAFTFRCDHQTRTIFGIRSSTTDCRNFEESNTQQESLCPGCARKEAVRIGLQTRPNNLDQKLRTQKGTSSCGSSTASRSTRSSSTSNSTGSVISRASTTPSEHDVLEASMQAIIDLKVQESTKAFEAAGGMRSLTAGSAADHRAPSLASRQTDQKTTDSLPATLALAVEMTNARAVMVELTPARAPTKADLAGAAIRGAFAPQFSGVPATAMATAKVPAPGAAPAPHQVSENPRMTQHYFFPYKAPSLEEPTRTREEDAISIMSTGPDFGIGGSSRLHRSDSLFLPTENSDKKACVEEHLGEVTLLSPGEVLKPGAARRDDRDSLPSGRVVEPRLNGMLDVREQNPAPRIMPILLEPSSVANDYAKFRADIAVKREAQKHVPGQRANPGEGYHYYKNYSLPSRGLATTTNAANTTVTASTCTAEPVQLRRVGAHIPLDKPLPPSPRNKSWEVGDDRNPLPTSVRRSRATSVNGRSGDTPATTLASPSRTRKVRSQPAERSEQDLDHDGTFFVPRRPRPTIVEVTPVTPQSVPASLSIAGGRTLRRIKALPTKDGKPDCQA
ncbi:hypothetical protein PpBr36_03751 [Pyricularia pennisetigena]|uniref:hypothetical protein n=1 Tax=Pyricularia pennisetigena TaxID=1578925 RepID=UPI0011513F7B|nr:hypothetical protein PpBr36_03751 [Pyricularia pennisetigena]TLS30225.1 hypothetical protein PpBr36_03751 [Pyricularia pennisetigena]